MKTQEPRGLGTAARSLPSRVYKLYQSIFFDLILCHAHLENGLGAFVEDVLVELRVIHG